MVVVVRLARAVSILLMGALVAAGCAASFDVDAAVPPTPTPEVDGDGATGIAPGDCLSDEGLRVVGVAPVPCDRPHIAEVFAVDPQVEPVSARWPGVEVLQRRASDVCNDGFLEAFGVAGQISVLDILFLRPQEETWADGDREVVCFVRFPEEISTSLAELDPLRAFGLTSTFGLQVGDCVASPSLVDDVAVELVDCSEPHWFEVYASSPMLDGPYPGDDSVLGVADVTCRAAFEDYVGIPRGESGLRVERLFPTEQSWTAWGDRLVTCVLSAGEQLTESLAGSQR